MPRHQQSSIYLPDDLRARLRSHAEATGLTMADLIRLAIRAYLTAPQR